MEDCKVLRVGVYNNFNFTEKELEDVRKFEKEGYSPFVNSNSFVTIKANYPSILTINPYLDSFVEPVGDLSNVKACRIKVVAYPTERMHDAQIAAIDWCCAKSIPILFTFMRFSSKESLAKYTDIADSLYCYEFRGSYWRLKASYKEWMAEYLMLQVGEKTGDPDHKLANFCDLAEKGCPECRNCAKLTYGTDTDDIYGLTLSCSNDEGKCMFHCPDCWAHKLSKIATFKLDEVTKNSKQKGKH